jgi:hypothetical protein
MIKNGYRHIQNLKEGLEIIKWLEIHLKELRNEMRNFRTACVKILKKSDIFTYEILFSKQHGTKSFGR